MRTAERGPRRLIAVCALLALFSLTAPLGACTDPAAPEQIVRGQITAALDAAREKDLGDVFDDVADDFSGPRGATLRETKRTVAGYLLRPGWMTVFAPRVDVAPPEDGIVRARIELVVARGRPVEELEDVLPTNADRFTVRTTSRQVDGAWRFSSAEVDRVRIPK